jgi:hypothetical protein
MEPLLTQAKAATQIQASSYSAVRRVVKEMSLGQRVGNARVLTRDDVARLEREMRRQGCRFDNH